MTRRAVALLPLLLGCTSPTDAIDDADALLVTDESTYTFEANRSGSQIAVRFTFSNRTGRKVSLHNCNRGIAPNVEELVNGRWQIISKPLRQLCLSPAIEIAPGQQFRGEAYLRAEGSPLRLNGRPIGGIYRLNWDLAYWDYDDSGPPWGNRLPPSLSSSNRFQLRAP